MLKDFKLTAVINVLRHGEKSESGQLTENGMLQAKAKANDILSLEGDLILVHSGSSRVQDTLEYIKSSLSKQHRSYLLYESHLLQYLYNNKISGNFFSNWESMGGSKDKEETRIIEYLSFLDNSPESEIFPSPKAVARRLARLILTELDFASVTVPEYRTNFINGTHEPVIMAFLYYYLADQKLTPYEFLKEIKSTVGYTEGIEFLLYQKYNDIKVTFKFRDNEHEVDIANFKKLVRG